MNKNKMKPKKNPIRTDIRHPELMDSTQVLAYQFRKCKTLGQTVSLLKETILTSYLNGKGARIKTDEGYYIWIPNNVNFDTICPECGAEMTLDLKEMISTKDMIAQGVEAVTVPSDLEKLAKRWNASHSARVPYKFIEWLEGKL